MHVPSESEEVAAPSTFSEVTEQLKNKFQNSNKRSE
jgi:hypothetical protein